MKKEKSLKALISVLIILIGILLAVNVIIKNVESNCLIQTEELQNNLTNHYFNLIHETERLNLVVISALIANFTQLEIVDSKTLAMPFEASGMEYIVERLSDIPTETQQEIFDLEQKMINKSSECKFWFLLDNVLLYFALILYLISFYCGVLVYHLYKT